MLVDRYSDIYMDNPKLRPYQQKAKREIFEAWNDVDNVMFQMPTGTGKTRLFTSIIRDINHYSIRAREAVKILIIAHRTELIDQIDESLKKYHVPHNVIGGSRKKREEDDLVRARSIKEVTHTKKASEKKFPVHVASIQTLTHPKNLDYAKKLNVQFIIIDEAHHALATTYKKLWDLYPGSKRLGVTATPWRMNHQSFTDLFDKLVMSMPIKDFIKQGYLSPYKYFSLRDDSYIQKTIDGIELDKFGEYSESSMEENMDIGKIRAQLLSSYQSLARGKKGIIYAINIAHARHISKEYEAAGYRVVAIDSKTTDAERIEMVRDFKKGKIDIIVNVDIFSEGFDCPDIEFIQLARPTRSLVKYLQQVGRGLRITESKEHCIILDNVGMYSRFGLPDARRHWNYHFLGHEVDEEPPRRSLSKGTGKSRYVDMSEGTEDMELIQNVIDDVKVTSVDENVDKNAPATFNDFFPIFDFALGQTTWKQAEEMGYEVEIWKKGPDRTVTVGEFDFWDYEGGGRFTSLYVTSASEDDDLPSLWRSKGFSWDNSYDEWMEIFKKLGFDITITQHPSQGYYSGHRTLSAEFEALSSDGKLLFDLHFDYGDNGHYTSSPNSLYSITVNYNDQPHEENEDSVPEEEVINAQLVEDDVVSDSFDPMTKLQENNYKDDNFVFGTDDNEHIYEAYIQDDAFFIVSELIIDEAQHCVYRNRVGKISSNTWMFEQLEKYNVEAINSINHLGANYTVFHYKLPLSDNTIKDKYFDYKGREVEAPSVVEEKYAKAKSEGSLHDYIDVPVSKATFVVDLLERTSHISITRTIKGISKSIAIFKLRSHFGRMYYELDKRHIKLSVNGQISRSDANKIANYKTDKYEIIRSDFKTFTVKCIEGGKASLRRFDFNGKLIKDELIAEDNEVQENTEVDINFLTDSDTDKLLHAFDKKATSYKYFWFWSILKHYKESGMVNIPFRNILIGMVALAWKYVDNQRFEFPEIDQLPSYIRTIKIKSIVERRTQVKTIKKVVSEYYEQQKWAKLLEPLLKNVPYRFLSPWIPFTSNEDVISKSMDPEIRCPYGIKDNHVKIKKMWQDYFNEHYDEIIKFIENELETYLKKN